jgi:hypothetical protein
MSSTRTHEPKENLLPRRIRRANTPEQARHRETVDVLTNLLVPSRAAAFDGFHQRSDDRIELGVVAQA